SSLRPHCLAHLCLLLWIPSHMPPRCSNTNIPNKLLAKDELNRILGVLGASWADSTKELYSTGLLVYHVYCDIHDIPDSQYAPIFPNLLASFLASCAGAYSGSTISNYTAAIKAWHILHGLRWNINKLEY
ncbi:hypothetical protein OG21DRAFT_1373379, partial [Imleria badia]